MVDSVIEKRKVATAILINSENKILAVKRASDRKYNPNKWSIISGHIEENETPRQCVERELKEELLGEIKIKSITQGNNFLHDDSIVHKTIWDITPFLVKYISGEIIIDAEHTEFKWVTIQEYLKMDIIEGTRKDLLNVGLLE